MSVMIEIKWNKLPRSERAVVGTIEADVWPVGGGARYSILDTASGIYLGGGLCGDVAVAKEQIDAFV